MGKILQNCIKLKILTMMFVFALITGMTNFAGADVSDIKIGVLANRGTEHCMEEWKPTADYLTQMIQGKTFVIVPLDFEQIYDAVKKADIDFILANPVLYVELEALYKVSRIATLKNKVFNKAYTEYGSVVFTKKNRDDIQDYKDLKGKNYMAVHKTSLGGWLMAWREFKQAGVDPFKDFASINFGQTHDAVVYAVRDGKVDAGNVRTDTLERMQAEDKIQVADFKAIHEHGGEKVHLPFVHSTRSYPERPLAKLLHTPIGLAEMVVKALLAMPPDSAAAQAAKIAGWTIPLNYQDVHACLKELKVGPYKDIGKITAQAIFKKYWILILIYIVILVVLAGFLFTIARLNQKVRKANKELTIEVDQRIQAEAALRQSEYQFSTHLQNTSVGAISLDLDFKTIGWNPGAESIFGYTKEQALGRHVAELILPKDMKKLVDDIFQDILCLKGGAHSINENITKDGRRIICDWYNTAIKDIDGKVTGLASLVNDITELKKTEESLRESEEKYRSILESMDDVAYICSSEYVLSYLNPAMVKWIGHDATGKLCYKAIHGRDEKCSVCFHHKVMQGKVIKTEVISTKDNKPYHCSFSPVSNKGGSVSMLAIYRDIGDLKKMESQLQQAQKMESMGTLAGGIAHDFNNILFPVIGYTEMILMDTPEDSPLKEHLNQIHTSALRARDLVKQILTFSRQDSSELMLMKMQPVVKEALKLIRSTIPTSIEIKQDINPDCGVIKADPTQIHQIVMNLATNAYHAMEENGGELKVSLKQMAFGTLDLINPNMKPGVYACLTVADTGKGMDKKLTDKIFDPFFTTKAIGKGTGMGLSVVHGIVTAMGGAIQVYSEPGKGTEFHVYMPVEKSLSEEQNIQTKTPLLGGTEQILLVYDEEAILGMEKKMLERLGYQVTSRTSSLEALEAFRTNPDKFDLIITDMAMPNMAGDKLSAELIKIRSDIPILLCTGFSETMYEEKATSLGIKGFILKPIVMKDLAQKIRELLE